MVKIHGNIKGTDEVLNTLNDRFVKRRERIVDRALIAGAQMFVRKFREAYQPYKKHGHVIKEITYTQPYTENGQRVIKIHWKGPKGRYRVIHLLEFGTIKAPNPPQKGVIQRTLHAAQAEYLRVVKDEMKKL